MLIARNQAKLAEVEAGIKKDFPSVDTKVIVADFSSTDPKTYQHIRDELAGLEIGTLVRCAGSLCYCVVLLLCTPPPARHSSPPALRHCYGRSTTWACRTPLPFTFTSWTRWTRL